MSGFKQLVGSGGIGTASKNSFPPKIFNNNLLVVFKQLVEGGIILTAPQTHCPPEILNSHLLLISMGNR